MRKKEKEITDREVIESIIRRSLVCRVALSDGTRPYLVPLNFGYRDNTLYFHSAREGKKIDILRKNNKVCFEFDIDNEIISAESGCKWTMKYLSVIGYGNASFIDEPALKKDAFDIILRQYSDGSFQYDETAVSQSIIIKVEIESMTGKNSGY